MYMHIFFYKKHVSKTLSYHKIQPKQLLLSDQQLQSACGP
jgi:hypothetical protein